MKMASFVAFPVKEHIKEVLDGAVTSEPARPVEKIGMERGVHRGGCKKALSETISLSPQHKFALTPAINGRVRPPWERRHRLA